MEGKSQMKGTLENLEEHACSVLSRIRQWKELKENFKTAHYLAKERAWKLELLDGFIRERYEILEAKETKVEMMKEKVFQKVGAEEEKEPKEKPEGDPELSRQLRLAQELFEKHVMEVREKELQAEFIKKRSELKELRSMEEEFRFEIFAAAQDLLHDLKGYEYKLQELDLWEKEIEKQSEEVDLKGQRCQERLKEVELMKKLHQDSGTELYPEETKPEKSPKQKKRSRSASFTEASASTDSSKRVESATC